MSIEQKLIPALKALVAPIPVYMLHAPQLDDEHPINVPFVLVTHSGTFFDQWDTFCRGNDEVADVYFNIDCVALTLEETRRLSDQIRTFLSTWESPTSPDGVYDVWNPNTRVYQTSASYVVNDPSPALT